MYQFIGLFTKTFNLFRTVSLLERQVAFTPFRTVSLLERQIGEPPPDRVSPGETRPSEGIFRETSSRDSTRRTSAKKFVQYIMLWWSYNEVKWFTFYFALFVILSNLTQFNIYIYICRMPK